MASPLRGAEPDFQEVSGNVGAFLFHAASGFPHWEYTGGGAAGDFNNDGWMDVFIIRGGDAGLTDKLLINLGGTFEDQAEAWGVAAVHSGVGAAVGDFNDDGWIDLFVTSMGPDAATAPGHHRLYKNNGDNTFTNIAASAGVDTTTPNEADGFGSAFGDYDLDGDLDLIVAGFANNNAGSRLFMNNGDETFTDVTAAAQLFEVPGSSRGFAPRFVDMDGDRYPELLFVADFGTTRYFRNNGDGTFTDFTEQSGTSQEENGMGQAVGDFNGDGKLDWYVTSAYNTGAWTGNKLYINLGNHSYEEVASAVGVHDGGFGWGALACDFDHDGRLDIAATNGWEGVGQYADEQTYLWLQTEPDYFAEQAMAVGLIHHDSGRGMINLDMDNDGDQDVIICSNNDSLNIFRNDLIGKDHHWLRVFLSTRDRTDLAPHGMGAVVTIESGGHSQMRAMSGGDNFLSHSELSVHFGVGANTSIATLRTDWSDGSSTTLYNVDADQTLTITPAMPHVADIDINGRINHADYTSLNNCFAGPSATPEPPCVPSDVTADGFIDLLDFATLQIAFEG
jgi:hypothetical protein